MTRTSTPHEPASPRRRLVLLGAAAVLVAAVVVTVEPWSVAERPVEQVVAAPTPTVATTMAAARATTSAAPTTASVAAVPPGVPVEVRVDAVGLDAQVLPTASVAGAFDPPTLGEAYWIEAFGAPGTTADNTVYLLGHSWSDGDAVFNPLFDRASQTSTVAPGDDVVVTTGEGDVTYQVERTERIPKVELARETNEVWDVVPGRLLLITCFQNEGGGRTLDNFVIFATLRA